MKEEERSASPTTPPGTRRSAAGTVFWRVRGEMEQPLVESGIAAGFVRHTRTNIRTRAAFNVLLPAGSFSFANDLAAGCAHDCCSLLAAVGRNIILVAGRVSYEDIFHICVCGQTLSSFLRPTCRVFVFATNAVLEH